MNQRKSSLQKLKMREPHESLRTIKFVRNPIGMFLRMTQSVKQQPPDSNPILSVEVQHFS
ncbi:hypothetical protein LSS_09893 [Leptospira santarosai serovar Shermani str. LT 821]|uniref:Uncharacterized protein n=1 Tax=Leptospira santarosai serovar Shermani str. LT 821 TaxID=758847 RepID=K8Y1N0_9LEPT|nr:hypothetical protein LSS_09893 [Leptospira santarosai serovar Shermani str. LT 821]